MHLHPKFHHGLPSEFVTNHLDVDLLTHTVPQATNEVFVNPGLKLAHPNDSCQRTGHGTLISTFSLPESSLVVWGLAAVAGGTNLHVVELALRIQLLWDLSLGAIALSTAWRAAVLRALLAVEVGFVVLLETHCASDS